MEAWAGEGLADALLENMSENQVPEGAGRESNNGL